MTTTTHVNTDAATLVSLSRLADVLNEFFNLDVDDLIQYDTPFVWWDRSKRNHGISLPMPEPVTYASAAQRSPLWHQDQILHWYGSWREVEVPESREAGDRTDSRGRFRPSAYRQG